MLTNFTYYSTARVSDADYQEMLTHFAGSSLGTGAYDARVARDHGQRFLNVRLAQREEPEFSLFTDAENMQKACGDTEFVSAIKMDMNEHLGAYNILVDVVRYLHPRFPGMLITEEAEAYPSGEIQEYLAQQGYDGYHWNADRTAVVKDADETDAEIAQRLKQARIEQIHGTGAYGFTVPRFTAYLVRPLPFDEFSHIMAPFQATITPASSPFESTSARVDYQENTLRCVLLSDVDRQRMRLDAYMRQNIINTLGQPFQQVIELSWSRSLPLINLALDMLLALQKASPLIVLDAGRELHTPEELLEFAIPGYFGYDWNADHV